MIDKLTDEEIEEVLKTNVIGRIGCNDGSKTYVVPISYVYDGRCIIGHSHLGQKIEMMRKNPSVCFEVDEMKNINHWKSVILWGTYQELTNERERLAAMKLFMDKFLKLKINKSDIHTEITEKDVHPHMSGNIKPVIYRIVISEKTGRFENN